MFDKYPYTDFHELNLDWFLTEFKKVTDKVTTLDETVKEFTEFVTNYFDDLDVQEEINNKLNAMVEDGTLADLLRPMVLEDVNIWLADNITNPSNPPLDASLSLATAAAPAKTVGDALTAVNSDLSIICAEKIFALGDNDIKGYIASDDNPDFAEGTLVTSPPYSVGGYRTKIIPVRKGMFIKATLGNTPNAYIMSYVDADGTFISPIIKGACKNYLYQVENDGYIALVTNTSLAGYNSVTIIGYVKDEYLETPEIGWKDGIIRSGYLEYSSNYFISNPIPTHYGDKFTVHAKATTTAYVFCLTDENGSIYIDGQGTGQSAFDDYTYTADYNGTMIICSYKADIANATITIDRANPALDTSNHNEEKTFTSLSQFVKPTMFAATGGISDLPDNTAGDLIVFQHNYSYVMQMLFQYSKDRIMVRLLGTNGTPYRNWFSLKEIKPEINTIYNLLTTNEYHSLFSGLTSLNEFTYAPFTGSINAVPPVVTDRPAGVNGVLTVLTGDQNYVQQNYYMYTKNLLVTRLLNRNTNVPYNDWKAQGEPLFNKDIIGIGDSLMKGNQIPESKTWLNLLSTYYGANIHNYGINGNTVARQTIETDNPAMVDRISTIYAATDHTDYFVLIGGANDKRLSVPIGSDDSADVTTFCGALNSIIDQVRSYYPKSHIVFLTNYDRYSNTNTLGLTDIDYVEAMQRVCALKHIYCYDNYHDSGVDFDDANFSAWADEGIYRGLTANRHFSPDAYEWLLPKYKAVLEAN